MPGFPIIDAHLHLWDPDNLRYPWLDNKEKLNRTFLLRDYDNATESLQVEKMVFVQCECIVSQCELEVAWATSLAKLDTRIQGVVPLAPLEQADVIETLERYATNPLIKGIRRIIQFESDPEFCLKPEFIRGVQLLGRFNFTFDICINWKQLPQTIALVSKCPDVKFMLDHIAKPDIKNKQQDSWRRDIQRLAAFPNVFCKLSGLVTEADFVKWTPDDLKPYVGHILDCFGVHRLVFGGDWPVVTQAATLRQWVDTLDGILGHLSQDELRSIYRENAARFYRL